MGNCCGGVSADGEVNMAGGKRGAMSGLGEGMEHIFDDREILGLKGAEKINIIIRIQSLFRGKIARTRVQKIHGFTASPGLLTKNTVDPNYDNQTVMEIKKHLGSFNYEPAPSDDGVARKKRALITLENGARYEGEWNESSNKRDGRGY